MQDEHGQDSNLNKDDLGQNTNIDKDDRGQVLSSTLPCSWAGFAFDHAMPTARGDSALRTSWLCGIGSIVRCGPST